MGRKKIHENDSAKYKAYRLRKQTGGRFVRVFVPSEVDKKFRLERSPGRLVELAMQSEGAKKEILRNLYYFLEVAQYPLFVLQRHKDVNLHPVIRDILLLYFRQANSWFRYARNQFGISLNRETGLKSRLIPLEKCMSHLKNKIDPQVYNSLLAEIQEMIHWTNEHN
jgi:hypothetical protein